MRQVPRAIINIDQTAQVGQPVCVNRQPAIPNAQDRINLITDLQTQTRFAGVLPFAGRFKTVTQFF